MNPRQPALPRPLALRLAATEYDRCTAVFSCLEPGHWTAPTDCPAWDVRQMAAHMLGMAEMAASMRENLRQQRLARRALSQAGGLYIDALTQLQVDERAGWAPDRITRRYQARAPKAVTGRRRAPSFVRHRAMSQLNDINGAQEPWTFGYLIDIILTRDPWMHRIDITRATSHPLALSADHDGVIVADIVNEWAGRHSRPCRLDLSGPAGGSWTFGHGGPNIELDAVEFCRTVSGREPATDLLATEVPF